MVDKSFGRNETYSKLLHACLAPKMSALALLAVKHLSSCSALAKAYSGHPTAGWAMELYQGVRQTLPMSCVSCAEKVGRSLKTKRVLPLSTRRLYLSLSGQKFAKEAWCLKACAKHGEVCAEHQRHSGSVYPPQQGLEYRKLSPGERGRGCVSGTSS